MLGTTVGRYRIVAKLGEGGMGSVWRAEDPLLGRAVALKFLPQSLASSPAARQRFVREAQAASRLEHAAIATVYDAGEADGQVYIAMQLVPGETVAERVRRGALPLPEAVRIAARCAEALAHAHARGIVHRDVKSSNLMLADGHRVVLVDFGLALPEGQERLTTTGATVGTVAYMAPEVIRGAAGDARADIYGLGVVLYEMLTGTLPFTGERTEALLYAAVHAPVRRPSERRPEVPPELDRVVLSALVKDPAQRYAAAADLAHDLETVSAMWRSAPAEVGPLRADVLPQGVDADAETATLELPGSVPRRAPPARGPWRRVLGLAAIAAVAAAIVYTQRQRFVGPGRIESVAVLPFQGVDPEADWAYVAEGLGSALATKLTQLHGLRVTPWITSQAFDAKSMSLETIARELRVDALLVGTLRLDGDALQATLHLVDGRSGLQQWADEFEEPVGSLQAMERRIALEVASRMRGTLVAEERGALSKPTSSSDKAYDLYRRGAYALQVGSRRSTNEALEAFVRALELDPNLGPAHVGVGAAYSQRYFFGWEGGRSNLEAARASFERAIELEPGLGPAYRGLQRVYFDLGWSEPSLRLGRDFAAQGREDVEALLVRADAYFFGGLPEKAVPFYQRALELDPANQGALWTLVPAAVWAVQSQVALAAADSYRRRFGPDGEVYLWAAVAHQQRGELDLAVAWSDSSLAIFGDDVQDYAHLFAGLFLARAGRNDEAMAMWSRGIEVLQERLDESPDNSRYLASIAALRELTGDHTGAMDAEHRFRQGDPKSAYFHYMIAAHVRRGDLGAAAALLDKAVALSAYGGALRNVLLPLILDPETLKSEAIVSLFRADDAVGERLRKEY